MKPLHSLRPLATAAVLPLLLLFTAFLPAGCGGDKGPHALPDTLVVGTLYGPASYFYYRDTTMGVDYDMVEELAAEHGFAVRWEVAPSLQRAIEWLDSGRVELLAADVPVTKEYRRQVVACGPETVSQEVLVQPAGDTVLVDVVQLIGQDVFVEKGSKQEKRLRSLDRELGGGIRIHAVDSDSLSVEDMLALVAADSIPMAVVDSETARLNKTYYPNLNLTLPLTLPERSQWAVARSHRWLADTIDSWIKEPLPREMQAEILKRYFETSRMQQGGSFDLQFDNGYASPFDHLYRRHATPGGWDWRLLAAQGFTESRFDSTARSWAGATGVMQIMPRTAQQFGLARKDMTSAEASIQTAVKILNAYDDIMAKKVSDPEERQKFVMAAYNAGPGHVLDAINLAKKYGLNPQKWDDNVEKAMLMKMKRKYYRDPVVKYGYSRGRETVDYVKRIWAYYDRVKEKVML